MAKCKTAVTPLRWQWSYRSLTLSHRSTDYRMYARTFTDVMPNSHSGIRICVWPVLDDRVPVTLRFPGDTIIIGPHTRNQTRWISNTKPREVTWLFQAVLCWLVVRVISVNWVIRDGYHLRIIEINKAFHLTYHWSIPLMLTRCVRLLRLRHTKQALSIIACLHYLSGMDGTYFALMYVRVWNTVRSHLPLPLRPTILKLKEAHETTNLSICYDSIIPNISESKVPMDCFNIYIYIYIYIYNTSLHNTY